jgi:hypothetical protein
MDPHRQPYTATPADLDRIARVHDLITGRPEEFRQAGGALDRNYSPNALYERAQKQCRDCEEALRKFGPLPNRSLKPNGLEHLLLSSWIPEECMTESLDWWGEPLRRWEVVLFNLIQGRLPIAFPDVGWARPAEVLLIYWITCEPSAERAPKLSLFQDWPWDGPDIFRRATALSCVDDWPRLNGAVDFGLAVAARRFSKKRRKPGRPFGSNLSDRATDQAIRAAWETRQHKTYAALAQALGKDADTVRRALDRTRKHGPRA